MAMKRTIYILTFISLAFRLELSAQEWAGPDKNICEGAGTTLGLDSAPNNYCYNWSPSTGLSSTTDKRPMAHPDKTTEYTLVAIGPNFSNKVVDKVKVTVETGGVVLTPTYTQPDSSVNQSHAHLTIKTAGVTYKWSIVGDDKGCQINENTGNISYCHQIGDVKVRVKDADNPDCFADGTLRVNVGVKELFAIDNANPTRKASNGDTLHLVGINAVKLKAIPNSGESFGDDQPDWTGSTVLPPNPHDAEWVNDAGTPTSLTITAGQKNVYVSRETTGEISAGVIAQSLSTIFNRLKELVKPTPGLTPGNTFDPGQTTACLPFSAEIIPTISYKKAPVNRKDSPKSGYAWTIEGDIKAEITGRVCFPPPYSAVPNPVFVWSTYVIGQGAGKLTMNMVYDESVNYPGKWVSNGLNFVTEFKLGVGGEIAVLLPGNLFGITGSLFGGVKWGIDPDWAPPYIDVKASIEPLVIEGGLKVWYFNPANTVIDLQGKYNMLDPITMGPYHTIDLRNYGHQ
jgi:hypothetical protein